MKKSFAATFAALAALAAFGTGSASAASCSADGTSTPYNNTGGTVQTGPAGSEVFVLGSAYDVGGKAGAVGYGQADPDDPVTTSGTGYNGTLASGTDGTGPAGYGDVSGTANGTDVDGSADGAVGPEGTARVDSSGTLTNTTSLSAGVDVNDECAAHTP